MHKTQKTILKRLLLNNNQKYSSLTSGFNFEDNIVFHLKQLSKRKLIEKRNGFYSIAINGIKEIAKFDLSLLEERGLKTFFVGFISKHKNRYLLKEHVMKANIFYNLPSGKPFFGESIKKSLERIFYESTGLRIDASKFNYQSLHLKTIKTTKGKVLFDDAFAIYKIVLNQTEKSKMKLHNQIKWFSINRIKNLPNRWPEVDLCILEKNRKDYLNYSFTSDYYLKPDSL